MWPEIAGSARFTLDRNSLYANNKVYIIPQGNLYLLALLNSTLLRAFIQSSCTDLQGDSFNFSAVFVDKTPIYPAERLLQASEERYRRLENMADQMLELHHVEATAKDGQDKTVVRRQIDAIDLLIDEQVYELYGLTEEEIRTVERSLSVTKTNESGPESQ